VPTGMPVDFEMTKTFIPGGGVTVPSSHRRRRLRT
jgi:hypothetical protein